MTVLYYSGSSEVIGMSGYGVEILVGFPMADERTEVCSVKEYRRVVCSRCGVPCSHGGMDSPHCLQKDVFLACGGLTCGLRDGELEQVLESIRVCPVKTGELILKEGNKNREIFLVLDGEMSVCKRDEQDGGEFEISRLGAGSFFGEMSWLDSQPASATVMAVTEGRVAAVSVEGLSTEIRLKIAMNIARGVTKRLREQNSAHVRSLVREAQELRMRNLFGRFYIVTMVIFGIVTVIPLYFQSAEQTGLRQMFNSWLALFILLLPTGYFLHRAHLPASTFGLTFTGWRQALRESGLIILLLTVILFSLHWFLRAPDDLFFSWSQMQGYTPGTFFLYLALYPIHSFLQELLARGVLQGALQVFLGDVHCLVPSFLVSILFGVAHLQYGLATAWLTFSVSMIFGITYYRHRTLVGVTCIHAVVGTLAMAVGWI